MPTVLTGLHRLTGEQIRPIVSPLLELGSALHVLAEPGHHDRLEWAVRVKATMTAAENAELDAWSWTYRAVRARIFVTYPPAPDAGAGAGVGVNGWQGELERLRARPAEELAADLVRPLRGDPPNHPPPPHPPPSHHNPHPRLTARGPRIPLIGPFRRGVDR